MEVIRGCDAQVMLRVSNLEASIKYYEECLGMKLLRTRENPGATLPHHCNCKLQYVALFFSLFCSRISWLGLDPPFDPVPEHTHLGAYGVAPQMD